MKPAGHDGAHKCCTCQREFANAPAEARVLPSPPAGCSAWIAVRDRFPDDARDVLTFGRYGVHKACFEWGTEDDPCWWTDEVRKADFKESVTHWAELPNASGEGRGASPRTSPPPCSASELTSQPERPLADRYNELLYAVARKFPGESRHETALRYIRQAEEVHAGPCMQNAALTGGVLAVPSNGVVGTPNQKGGVE
jgi:hypothetical protein